MKKIISIIIFVLIALIINSCSIANFMRKDLFAPSLVASILYFKVTSFEEGISCYYSQNKKFPTYNDGLKNYLDTAEYAKDLFSKFQLIKTNTRSKEYYFVINPFPIHFQSYSSKPDIDSIKFKKTNGYIIFSDSLISAISDTLLFKLNFSDIEATVYLDKDSTEVDEENEVVKEDLDKCKINKIPYRNICK